MRVCLGISINEKDNNKSVIAYWILITVGRLVVQVVMGIAFNIKTHHG